ncbi:hypothetical protein SASPL_139228 [Salvia splendens]|uniref:Uncharacterized protein n=1 Tax=Salvia splendens TaxID=180675 RepID=A0A8X8WXX9_SALSN|nr:hypothetical protein SASPL_139228 [Salvia splendens]
MVEVEAINGGLDGTNRPRKRKRLEPCVFSPSPEENRNRVAGFRSEIDSLVKYCKSLVLENRGVLLENLGKSRNSSAYVNGVIACEMEESGLPLSKLVDEIFEKLRDREGNGGGLSKAGVMSADEAECALWYWEVYFVVVDLHLHAGFWKKEVIAVIFRIDRRFSYLLSHAFNRMLSSLKCDSFLNKFILSCCVVLTTDKGSEIVAQSSAYIFESSPDLSEKDPRED